MTPFVAAQVHSVVEGLRLLEAFVTAPLGLHSDIRMLRQALSLPAAADLPQQEEQQRRLAYRSLTDDPTGVAAQTLDQLDNALALMKSVREPPLPSEWTARAEAVLGRARQRVGGELRAKAAAAVKGLYVIVDPETTRGRPVTDVAEAALRGGARVIQLRDKRRDRGEVLPTARQLAGMCRKHDALFFVNDDPGLAVSTRADGLHLGQTDLPVPEARRILGNRQLVGRSNNSMDEVAESQALAVDYVAIGAVFPTATMGKGERKAVGVQMVTRVKESAAQPVVAIGGISVDNVAEVVRAGADCVCVASAVTLADDPESAAGELVDAIETARS